MFFFAARICAIILPGAGPAAALAALAAALPSAELLSFTTVFVFFSFFPFLIPARRPPIIGRRFRGGPAAAAAAAASGSTALSFLKASTSAAEKPDPAILAHTAPIGRRIFSIFANFAYLAFVLTLSPPPSSPP